jgi:hypothetical protein
MREVPEVNRVSAALSIITNIHKAERLKGNAAKIPILQDVGADGGLEWEMMPAFIVPLTWSQLCDLLFHMNAAMCAMHGARRRPIMLGKLVVKSLPEFARERVLQVLARSEETWSHWGPRC